MDKKTQPRGETIDFSLTYEGVESSENFSSREEVNNYRQHALEKSAQQACFISRNFGEANSILEACCGNGRLLISLKDKFDRLEGFDLAKSRVTFAQSWIEDEGFNKICVWEDDILNFSRIPTQKPVDLAVCITGAFGYFDAVQEGNSLKAIDNLAHFVRPGGGLLFEFYQHPVNVRRCLESGSRIFRVWSELPKSDPFRFSLSEFQYDEDRHVLIHAKTFIHRSGRVDEGRIEALRIFSEQEVITLLEPAFENISLWGDWDDTPYSTNARRLIVTAQRRSGQRG